MRKWWVTYFYKGNAYAIEYTGILIYSHIYIYVQILCWIRAQFNKFTLNSPFMN